MKKRTNTSKEPKAESPRVRKRREERMRYLRQNTWLVLLAVLILVAVILFICVVAGGSSQPSQTDKVQSGKTERYVSGYICADTASIAYYDASLSEAGTLSRDWLMPHLRFSVSRPSESLMSLRARSARLSRAFGSTVPSASSAC